MHNVNSGQRPTETDASSRTRKSPARRRSLAVLPLLVLAATPLAASSSASGAPPEPVDPSPQEFAAGEACPFAIEVASEGAGGYNDLPDNGRFDFITTSPRLRITVTNASDPEKTVTVNATGAFRFVELPGGALEIVAGGRNFLYGVPEVGATALATTGPIEVLVEDGDIAEMDLSGARVRDLCDEIA
jgi:hypothetical protein